MNVGAWALYSLLGVMVAGETTLAQGRQSLVAQASQVGTSAVSGAVSGIVEISRGASPIVEYRVAAEVAGDVVLVSWPQVGFGNWTVRLTLFDASGAAIYTGTQKLLVSHSKPQPQSLTVSNAGGASVTVSDRSTAMLFCNTLDNPAAITQSAVGVPGIIYGAVDFAPVQLGNGVGDFSDNMSHVSFDNLFGSGVYTSWSVEAWVAWGNLSRQNYSIFTVQGAASAWGEQQFYVAVAQSPSGSNYIRDIAVIVQWPGGRYLEYVWRFTVPAVSTVQHVAASVNLAAAEGAKLHLYLDGVDQPTNYVTIEYLPDTSFSFPPYVRIGQSVPETPWVLGCYVDNLKVWSYAKSDFSDRYGACPAATR